MQSSSVLVDLIDGDLQAGVVLDLDDSVGCAALAGDVLVLRSFLPFLLAAPTD